MEKKNTFHSLNFAAAFPFSLSSTDSADKFPVLCECASLAGKLAAKPRGAQQFNSEHYIYRRRDNNSGTNTEFLFLSLSRPPPARALHTNRKSLSDSIK